LEIRTLLKILGQTFELVAFYSDATDPKILTIKDMKILEEYSKSTLTFLNECQVGHFTLVGSTHSEREVEDD